MIEIVDAVFGAHAPLAQWRWSEEAAGFMAHAGARSYCCQYRESDLDFVIRLLTEEGLAWRVEEVEEGEQGHCVVLFADTTDSRATPPDPSSAAGGLASPCKTRELAEHFRPYLIGRTEDGMEWPIRWADTRVLPHFIQALPKDIRTSLLRVVVVWGATSRDGAACFWYEERLDVPPPRFDKLPLSDAMFAQFVDIAEAEAVVAKIDELQPAMLRARQPSDCHRLVTRQLAIADQFNMQQARVRQHFSMLAFMLREEFVFDTEMQRLLGRFRDSANYDAEISDLSDHFWDRLANTATS